MRSHLVAVWIAMLLTTVPSEASADWVVRPFFGAALESEPWLCRSRADLW